MYPLKLYAATSSILCPALCLQHCSNPTSILDIPPAWKECDPFRGSGLWNPLLVICSLDCWNLNLHSEAFIIGLEMFAFTADP